jgi:LysM repeat protein
MNDTPQGRTDISRRALTIAGALLSLLLTVPVLGQNYFLYSAKILSEQEKKQFVGRKEPDTKRRKSGVKKNIPLKNDQIQVKDGVAYREITVQKGDSLFSISRNFSREGASYAEILRLNAIKHPDLIHIGDIIKVPVATGRTGNKETSAQLPRPGEPVLLKEPPAAQPAGAPVSLPSLTSPKPAYAGKIGENPPAQQTPQIQPVAGALSEAPRAAEHPVPARTDQGQALTVSRNTQSGQKLFEQAVKSYRKNDCQAAIQLFARFLAENTDSIFAPDASMYNADCYLKLSGQIGRGQQLLPARLR